MLSAQCWIHSVSYPGWKQSQLQLHDWDVLPSSSQASITKLLPVPLQWSTPSLLSVSTQACAACSRADRTASSWSSRSWLYKVGRDTRRFLFCLTFFPHHLNWRKSVSKVYKRQMLPTGVKKERSSTSQRDLIKNRPTIGQVGEPAFLMSFTHTWLHKRTHWNTQWCRLSLLQLASDIDTCDVLRDCHSNSFTSPVYCF